MFRDMRRKKQLLPQPETEQILLNGRVGILAVTGDGDYPYAVPVNYVYVDGKIYFHSAKTGHKLDGIQRNDRVSFCVIDRDDVVPEKFTSYFRSAVAFGRARIVTADEEKQFALEQLVGKYSSGYEAEGAIEIKRDWNITCVVAITIEHLTGKEAIELVQPQ